MYMYRMDLALNNLKELICQKCNQLTIYIIGFNVNSLWVTFLNDPKLISLHSL